MDEFFEEIASMLDMDIDEVQQTDEDMNFKKDDLQKDYIVIGESPSEEYCAQLVLDKPETLVAFHKQNHLECLTLINQMKRTTLKDFEYKENLSIKKNQYEGSYYEDVVWWYKIDSEKEEALVNFVEEALPEKWDIVSKKMLKIMLKSV